MMVADSDLLIDALRGREGATERIRIELNAGGLATTAVNSFELTAGAKAGRDLEKVEALLSALTILPLDGPASREAARVRRALKEAGRDPGMADCLIAGICIANSGVLLTRNRAHFAGIAGLALGTLPASGPRIPGTGSG